VGLINRKISANSPRKRSKYVSTNRYYGSFSRDKTPTKTKKNTKDISSNRFIRFIKILPQLFPIILIVFLIALNTTISGVSIKIQGGEEYSYRSNEDYTSITKSILNQSVFHKNKLTISSTDFEGRVMAAFPEVTSVSSIVPLAGRVLNVGMKLDSPMLRMTIDGQRQGIVGESGRLVLIADSESILNDYSALPNIVLEPKVSFDEGDLILTTQERGLITLLISEFDGLTAEYKPKLTSLRFRVDKREIQANFKGKLFYAKLTPEVDAKLQVGALVATLKQLAEQGSEPTEYLDVRVEERVYVK